MKEGRGERKLKEKDLKEEDGRRTRGVQGAGSILLSIGQWVKREWNKRKEMGGEILEDLNWRRTDSEDLSLHVHCVASEVDKNIDIVVSYSLCHLLCW